MEPILTLVDVGEDTTLGNGDMTQELVQFLIVADGELKVTGNDTGLLVIASSVASQFKNFGGEILKNGSEVNGSTYYHEVRVAFWVKTSITNRHQHAERSCPCGGDDEHVQRERRDRPWTNGCDRVSIFNEYLEMTLEMNGWHTIGRSCCRWPCLQICLQSFCWMVCEVFFFSF